MKTLAGGQSSRGSEFESPWESGSKKQFLVFPQKATPERGNHERDISVYVGGNLHAREYECLGDAAGRVIEASLLSRTGGACICNGASPGNLPVNSHIILIVGGF